MPAQSSIPALLAGTSFRFDGEPHLWFVISDPVLDPMQVLVVNLTTYDVTAPAGAYNDPACIVEPIEHPYPDDIDHTSCICYSGALVPSLDHLAHRHIGGGIQIKAMASQALLNKIRRSAGDSRYMEPDCFQVLCDQNLD